MNTPGTPDAAATALDGYPLAMQGKPLKATKMALFSSVTGDTFSDIVLITVSAPLAVLALRMGPVEVMGLIILAFCVIAGLIENSVSKGIIAAALGMLAISEILRRMSENAGLMKAGIHIRDTGDPADQRVSWAEYWSCRYTMMRGTIFGTILGALPGI